MMNATKVNEIAIFCERHGVTDLRIAAVLPAVFAGAARKMNMSERGMISTATYGNMELGAYLISVAVKVAG